MRRLLALGSCVVLFAACSDSGSTSPTTSLPAAATTVEAAATTSAAPAAAPVPITPEVVCVANNGSGDGIASDYAFAYTNDSDQAVVVESVESYVDNGEEADFVFVPRVFAPGHVSPAFFITGDGSETLPTWTIIGPDGQTRTATPDADTPSCNDDAALLDRTAPDPRDPIVEVSGLQLIADGTVAFTTTLTGAETSACPEGLEPRPTTITWDDGIGGNFTQGPTAEWTVERFEGTGMAFPYQTLVAVLVVDECASGDVAQKVWPAGVFESLYTGVYVCIADDNGTLTATTSQNDGECHGLPQTGGTRVRPS